MCADVNSNSSPAETQRPLGEALQSALKSIGCWPAEPFAPYWTPESIREWVVEEMESMNPLHLQALMMVTAGLRMLEVEEHVEYVEEVLDEVGHGDVTAESDV